MRSPSRHPARTVAVAFAVVLAALLLLPSVARAATDGTGGTDTRGDWVTLNGNIDIGEGDVVDGVVINFNGNVTVGGRVDGDVLLFNGNATVAGEITGFLFVLNGNATINGTVGDDVNVASGNLVLGPGAYIGGDARANTQPVVAPGATVVGSVEQTDFGVLFAVASIAVYIAWWVAVTVSTLVIGLLLTALLPRAAAATARAGRERFWPVLGMGVATAIALPILAAVAIGSFVGVPIGVGLVGAIFLLFPLAYVACALLLGKTMMRRTTYVGPFLAGWAVLRGIALVPWFGFLTELAATVVGLGALVVAAWLAARRPPVAPDQALAGPAPALVGTAPGQPLPPPTA